MGSVDVSSLVGGQQVLMKVLMIVNTDGALYIFRKPIINHLIRNGHNVESISGKSEFFDKLQELGVKTNEIDFSRHSVSLTKNLILLFLLERRIKSISPDIVHCFTHKPAIYGTIAAKLSGATDIYITITGLGTLFINRNLKSLVFREILIIQYRVALLFAKKVFFQNPDDVDYFLKRKIIRPEKVVLTNGSGIDLVEYSFPSEIERRQSRAMLSSEIGQNIDDRKVILFPARGVKEKGFYEYYAAAKYLNECEPSRFIFLHLGWVDEVVQSHISKEGINEFADRCGVHYLGFKHNIRDYLIASDVVALPSYREGVPRSLIEALALGRTIVTTDVPGCRETVIDSWNGYLVPVSDSSALASCISRVSDKFIEQAKNRSRDLCERKFDDKMVVDKTVSEYF